MRNSSLQTPQIDLEELLDIDPVGHLEERKKEDMFGGVAYGKTAGEAPIMGSLDRESTLAKIMIMILT